MIAIKVADTFLDLSDTSIDIQSVCPIFDRERIDRIYTFPFLIRATATNLGALGPFNRIDSQAAIKVPAELYLFGSLYEVGFLTLMRPGPQAAEFVFQNTTLNIRAQLERLKLRDLSMPVTVTTPYCPDVLYSCLYPTDSLTTIFFIIQVGDNIYEANIPDLESLVTAINADFPGLAEVYALSDFSDIYTPAEDFDYALLLFKGPACAGITINEAVAEPEPEAYFQFNLVGDVTHYEQLRINAAMLSYLDDTVAGTDTHVYPTIKAPNIYDQKNPDYVGYANYYRTTEEYAINTVPTDNLLAWPYTLIPQPRLISTLRAIATYIGIPDIAGSTLIDTEVLTAIIHSVRPIDLVITDWNDQKINVFQPSFNLAHHLPDTTALDLLQRFCATLLSYITVTDGQLQLVAIAPKFRDRPRDWTIYADPNFTGDHKPFTGYTLDYDRQGSDTDIPPQLQRIDGGPEAAEFITGMYTLHDITESDAARLWLLPFHTETGYSTDLGVSADSTVRLLLYRGLQPDSEGHSYPLAQHTATDFEGTATGSYALSWPGPQGLLAQWWLPFIRASVRNRTFTLSLRLPISELLLLRTWQHVYISIYTAQGQLQGIIQSIQFTATTAGISQVQVTFLQV